MRFATPEYLHVLWLIPAFALIFWQAARARRRGADRFGERELVAKLSPSVSRWRQNAKNMMILLALACLAIAVARPQIGTHAGPVKAEGIDLVFALDTSLSMLAEDSQPNRLTRAKHEMSALMDKLRGDRVGIVIFSGASFIQCPLTFDYSAAKMFLDSVNTNSISVPGTALESAIQTAMRAFENSPPNSAKVIVALTDGESHDGDALKAAEDAEKAGVKIETIPGIPAFCAIGSHLGWPIVEGDDVLSIIPATADAAKIRKAMAVADNVVIMKVYKNFPEIADLLEENGMMEKSVMVSRCGLPDEERIDDIAARKHAPVNYLSTILARHN